MHARSRANQRWDERAARYGPRGDQNEGLFLCPVGALRARARARALARGPPRARPRLSFLHSLPLALPLSLFFLFFFFAASRALFPAPCGFAMRVVGLTGGIACGKSSVAAVLSDSGIEVVDLDQIARDVVAPDRWGYRRVMRAFGREVLSEDGSIDRAKLGKLAFSDPDARRRLNRATHPAIFAALAQTLLSHWWRGTRVLVLDAPLLFESGLDRLTSVRVAVCATPAVQEARLVARDDIALEAARARIAAQMPVEEKARRSDYVIWNDGGRVQLESKAKRLATWLQGGAEPNEAVRETAEEERVTGGIRGATVDPGTVSQWGEV